MLTATLLLAFALQNDAAADDAIAAFKTSYKSTVDAERAGAVTKLAGVVHARTAAVILPLLNSDVGVVRQAAARSLGGFGDHKKVVVPALVRALAANTREPAVMAAIFESIGKLGDASALPAVHNHVDFKSAQVAKAAIGAAGAIRSAQSIPILIDQLKKLERMAKSGGTVDANPGGPGGGVYVEDDSGPKRAEALTPEVNKALNEITKEVKTTFDEWSAWWSKNRTTFKVP